MLTKKCQYALHALLYFAERDGEQLTVKEIATKKDIPQKFLETIFVELKSIGILGSQKGKSGGYYMKRHASKISVLEVIRAIDGAVSMIPCVSLNYYEPCERCKDEDDCTLRGLFSEVRDETLRILSSKTLDDLRP